MAGSSSSSGGLCKYDVFLSFRGEDTRKTFVCHLYRALKQKTINTFIDSKDLDKGSRISELLNAIEESRISIVVLSENYASSSWCLKELVKILECRDTKNQIVLPIFYEIDPSDIHNLNGKFGQAFANKFGGADKQELESWRSALARVADLSGWDSTKYEDDIKLIEGIVADTLEKWIRIARPSNPANDLVGMDSHIKEVSLLLCRGVNDVGVVGIWGMGGIGKTTIARAVYDDIAGQFEHKCFLDNVKEAFRNKREVKMQEELLCRLLKEKVESVDLNRGRNMIMDRLRRKKVLVVLDDVDTVAHIRDLLGNPHSFGVGSRIIITTRNKQSLSEDDELYKPKHLSDDVALELFMKYAFRENQPTGDYNDLSRRAMEYAQGLPLALKVLGASLYNKTEREWTGVLEKLKKIPHRGIMDVLKTSIEGLDDLEKDTFLDIACFLTGRDMDIVTEYLDACGFFPDTGLSILVDRALITLWHDDEYNEVVIDMHDLLQHMGKEMACQDPRGRSRFWSSEDVDRVLTSSTATEAIECIALNLSNSKFDLCIDTGAFGRMTKLRLLMICPSDGCKQHGRGNFESLSHELRILLWHGCPLNSLPSNFKPINLVRLDMRGGCIQQLWEGIKPLKNLKVIILRYCEYLVKIPNLTEAINLEKLVLEGCSSLIEVHPPISALQNLLTLSLKGCKELKIFPRSIHMKSLRNLDLYGCSNLNKFPENAEVMKELTWLTLSETAIKELPSSINNLTRLVTLNLKGCRDLKILPSCISMESLETLDLSGCQNVDKFPEIAEVMKKLTWLSVSETAIKELPSSINYLTRLVTLNLKGCRELKILPNCISMESLEALLLSGCSNLVEFPEISEVMGKLKILYLDETPIKELPSSINNLTGLVALDLKDCRELKILPSCISMESLETLDLSGCQNLDKFPEITEVMKKLTWLSVSETAIKELPSSINNLTGLVTLNLKGCRELKILPSCISMESLKTLDISSCQNLDKFPEITEVMGKLTNLYLDETPIKELPSSINNLTGLVTLDLKDCRELKILPSCISMESLKQLDLSGCQNLDKFPEITEVMKKLIWLSLSETAIKELPLSIKNLTGLVTLNLKGCRELKILPSCISMESLEQLDLSGCQNLDKFPEITEVMGKLTNLYLDETPIKELPSSINNLTGLVTLDLKDCRELKILPSCISMESLEQLDLSGCQNLDKFPEITEVMKKLIWLSLSETAIKELPLSINNLTGLVTLNLKGCRELKILPSCISMESLKQLDLSGCQNLDKFPEITEVMGKLTNLYLDETPIKELPSSINNLTGLVTLDLKDCRELKILPSCISMESLEQLDLSGCQNLDKFPEITEVMKKLIWLSLSETAIKELPSSIEQLQELILISMRNCRNLVCLPASICNLSHLTFLDLSGCTKLSRLPENIGSLNSLTLLEVQDSGIKQLPFSLSLLRRLRISLSRNGLNALKIPISEWWSSISLSQHTDHVRHLDLSDCNLLELSESIAQLSSLESLKLCRNKFESLPATMNRLGRLRDLRLEACDGLKSIPELSSSINYIDAHGCISLETVSKPKLQCHTKHFFTFSNCSRLEQTNLFRDIVERHLHFQDRLQHLRLKMSLPGNEVPDWFDHRSRGFSVSVQLPPNWFDSKFLGFAICAVRTGRGTNYHTSPLSAACLCTFKGNFGECSFSFDLLDSVFRIDRCLWSDHMFLGYVSWSECPLIEKGRLVNETYYTEATFQIVVVSEFRTEQLRITSCGVRLVYANQDEMLNLSMARPQFHVDSCETGVAFMDPCDMRNKETERVEITEVSREVESSEAGEGRDTCHRLQLCPELSELGSHSGLLVPEPQVREKERDTCHRLQLCPELSDLGNQSGLPVPQPQVREKERDTCYRLQLFPELSELGNHSGLLVPEPQITEKERDTCHRLELFPELSELGSQSGLLVPEPQVREKKRKSPWRFQ